MKKITFESYGELPDDPNRFTDYKNLIMIIGAQVEFPLRNKDYCDFRFDLREVCSYIHNYRKKFLHPLLYIAESFTEDGCKKINVLNILVKAGVTIIFIVDSGKENSLINACCFLREYLKGEFDEKKALTIPFPVKKADADPNDWIWSCYWPNRFSRLPRPNEDQSEKLINRIRYNFHKHNQSKFPVKCICKCNDGVEERVIAFSAKLRTDKGEVRIVTPDTKDYFFESEIAGTDSSITASPGDAKNEADQTVSTAKKTERQPELSKVTPEVNIKITKAEESEDFTIKINNEEEKERNTTQVLKFLAMYAAKSTAGALYLFQNSNNNRQGKIIIRLPGTPAKELNLNCIYKGSNNVSADVKTIVEYFLPDEQICKNYTERNKSGTQFKKAYGCQKVLLKNIHVELDGAAITAIDADNSINADLKVFILKPFKNTIKPAL